MFLIRAEGATGQGWKDKHCTLRVLGESGTGAEVAAASLPAGNTTRGDTYDGVSLSNGGQRQGLLVNQVVAQHRPAREGYNGQGRFPVPGRMALRVAFQNEVRSGAADRRARHVVR